MEADDGKDAKSQSAPTVLLIDDEPDLRELYAAFLKEEYTVVTAPDGDVSLELIRDEVDVVLSDRRMPETSGDELLRRLRANDIQTPVVFISAVNPTDTPETPCQGYLTKPVTGQELKQQVRRQTGQNPPQARGKGYS